MTSRSPATSLPLILASYRDTTAAALAAKSDLAAARVAEEALREPTRALSTESRLRLIDLEATALRREQAARVETARAAWALDTAQAAQGDTLAVACAPEVLRSDVQTCIGRIEAARAELVAAETALQSRVASARVAHAELTARRIAANEPQPRTLPPDSDAYTFAARLGEILDAGPVVAKNHAPQIAKLERQAVDIRADLELARQAAEEERENARRWAEIDRETTAKLAAQHEVTRAEMLASAQADRARREKLAAAYVAREAGK